MGPNRKGKFDNESPDGKTGEQGVQPVVQGPVVGMKDVGLGNDGEEIHLASLSFGSDTEYLAETYVIVDPEVEQNGSLEMESSATRNYRGGYFSIGRTIWGTKGVLSNVH
jgi:hypothetical protein